MVIDVPKMRLSALVYRLKKISSGHLKGEFRPDQIAVATILQFAGTRADGGAACSPQCIKLRTAGHKQKFAENGPFSPTRWAICDHGNAWSRRSGT